MSTDSLIARQSTPISGYSVCTIKRCASQMRAMAREVFILRGVCNVIKRMGKRRQRVFRRCGKPPERMKVDRHEAHDFETAIVLACTCARKLKILCITLWPREALKRRSVLIAYLKLKGISTFREQFLSSIAKTCRT